MPIGGAFSTKNGGLGAGQGSRPGALGPHRAEMGFAGGVSPDRLGSVDHRGGPDSPRGGGPDRNPGQGRNGFWLSNQQYNEYLQLLKERVQAQQMAAPPLSSASYPAMTLGAGGGRLAPYAITQPGYGFLSSRTAAGKPSGYGGLPAQYPAGTLRQLP